jgi:prolyl-tRNA editing enzyme YbaK/EbsC (Cys-tRNA(Pro) deacylase)
MIPRKVQDVLDRHGLVASVFEPGSTPTSPMAAAKLGVAVGQIAKSLLFVARDGRLCLVVCAGDRRVSNSRLKALIGGKSRMAGAEETLRATGYPPGGVCPFGLQGIPIYVDAGLRAHEAVYPACGDDASGVRTTYTQLLEITGGSPCDVCEEAAPT